MKVGPARRRFARLLIAAALFVASLLGWLISTSLSANAAGGSINGFVWSDLNNDGLFSAESGRSGVFVFLDLDDDGVFNNVDVSVVTDGTGAFSFVDVADGIYSVVAELPVGYGATTDNPVTTIVSGGSNNLDVNIHPHSY